MRIAETLDKFKAYLEAKARTERTVETYLKCVDLFAKWLKKKDIEKITDITRSLIDEYQVDLSIKSEYTKSYLSLRTQHGKLCALKKYFEFLHKRGLIDINPTSHIDLPRVPKSPPSNFMTYKEVISILKAANTKDLIGLRDRAILELLYSVGIRNTELRSLSVNDIDFNNELIRIYGKGRKERTIPIGKVALDYIYEYMQKVRPFLSNPKRPTDTLFLSKNGTKLMIDKLPDIINKYKARTSVKKRINAHTFRHSFATHLLLKGIDLRSLQELLGHSSLETTQIYTHLNLKDLKRAYSKSHPRENDLL